MPGLIDQGTQADLRKLHVSDNTRLRSCRWDPRKLWKCISCTGRFHRRAGYSQTQKLPKSIESDHSTDYPARSAHRFLDEHRQRLGTDFGWAQSNSTLRRCCDRRHHRNTDACNDSVCRNHSEVAGSPLRAGDQQISRPSDFSAHLLALPHRCWAQWLSNLLKTGQRRIGTEAQIRSLVTIGRRAGYIERNFGRLGPR